MDWVGILFLLVDVDEEGLAWMLQFLVVLGFVVLSV